MPVNIELLNSNTINENLTNWLKRINQQPELAPTAIEDIDIKTKFDALIDKVEFNLTIVHYAAMQSLPYLQYFIENFGIPVDYTTKNKNSLIYYAALMGNAETVKYLLVENANTTKSNNNGEEPIHYAAIRSNAEVIKLFLKQHPDLAKGNIVGETPLHIAARYGNTTAIKLFKEAGSNLNQGTITGITALHIAAENDQIKAIQLLKELGSNINQGTKDGYLPLHIAAVNGRSAAVSKLIEYGANINQGTGSEDNSIANFTATHFAAYGNHPQIINILKQHGANLNQGTQHNYTPLHVASIMANKDAISTLLQCQVNINAGDENWDTALFFASGKGKVDFSKLESFFKVFGFQPRLIPNEDAYQAVVEELLLQVKNQVYLQHGDVNHRQSAIEYAKQVGFTKIEQILTTYKLFNSLEHRPQQIAVLDILESNDATEFFKNFVKTKCNSLGKQYNSYFAKLRLNLLNIDNSKQDKAFEYNKFIVELKANISSIESNDNAGSTIDIDHTAPSLGTFTINEFSVAEVETSIVGESGNFGGDN